MGASGSGSYWDLRLHGRERLTALLRARYPRSRTQVRAGVGGLAAGEHPACVVDGDRVVGVVDRVAVLRTIAGEGD